MWKFFVASYDDALSVFSKFFKLWPSSSSKYLGWKFALYDCIEGIESLPASHLTFPILRNYHALNRIFAFPL
jgi:hypothetical protein